MSNLYIEHILLEKGFKKLEDNVFEHVNGLFVTVDVEEETWIIEDLNDVWTNKGSVRFLTDLIKIIEYFDKLNGGI